jgi:hypothetical protein
MQLDKELLNNLVKVYAASGPPDEAQVTVDELGDCPFLAECLGYLTHLQMNSYNTPPDGLYGTLAAAVHLGFETGLQYARLTRNKV